MALTAKPISTISYNTEQFLKRKLEQMLSANVLVDYRYICHKGEDGDKDHIHLLMFPNKRLDTGVLQQEFNEIPMNGSADDKPLGVLPIRNSQPDHWIMYSIHDAEYLRSHKSDNDGDGKIEYAITDIVTPYPDQLARDFKKALSLRNTKNQEVIKRLMQRQTVTTIIYETGIDPQKVLAIRNAMLQDAYGTAITRQEDIEQVGKLLAFTGEAKIVETYDQLHAEKKQGIYTERVREYKVNEQTGEIEQTSDRHEMRLETDDSEIE